MKAFWLAVVKLYQKQLLFTKLGKMGGVFWFSVLWPTVSNVTVILREFSKITHIFLFKIPGIFRKSISISWHEGYLGTC